MGEWFGNLQLAYKYAIVFGALLVLTLLAGTLRVLYTRRKLRKIIAKEGDPGMRSDEEDLNMRQKDEGDLFGIRAIEAGFFGGVAQSRPTSLANSPAGTPRSGSPVASNRNSVVAPKMINGPPSLRVTSASSVAGLPQSSADAIEPATPRNGTPAGLRQASAFSDNGEGRSSARRSPPSPLRVTRLQPSEAELNGRINHSGAVNMSLDVPPSPLHQSPTASQDPSKPGSPTYEPGHDRSENTSRESASSSRYSWRRSGVDHYAPQPPQLSLPNGIERTAFHEPNPHAHDSSVRASVVSSSSRSNRLSGEQLAPTLPTLPTLPPKAVTDPSNPQYSSRIPSPLPSPLAEASDPLMNSDARRSSGAFPAFSEAAAAQFRMQDSDEWNKRSIYAHSRTSSEYTGEAHLPPRASRKASEDIPLESFKPRTQYAIQPPGQRELIPSPAGKGGDFF